MIRFKKRFPYPLLIAISSSSLSAMEHVEGSGKPNYFQQQRIDQIKKSASPTSPQKSEKFLIQGQLDFSSHYPGERGHYALKEYFNILDHSKDDLHIIVDWCKEMSLHLDMMNTLKKVNPIDVVRCITFLGQKSKDKKVKASLQAYFEADPTFLEAWYRAGLTPLKAKNLKDKFNQQQLANIFYDLALLDLGMPADFKDAWYSATLTLNNEG